MSRLDAMGLPRLTLVVGGEALTGPHPVELHGSVFDVVRATGSRRSLDQIRRMHWIGDASVHFDKVFPFTPPAHDIDE